MLLLKFFLHRKPVIPDNGRLTRYELNAYPFEIIIGLQRYCFSLKYKTFAGKNLLKNKKPEYASRHIPIFFV